MSKFKNLEEFKAYQDKLKKELPQEQENEDRVIIGMGTCGIAAGAKEVKEAVEKELERHGLTEVKIYPTGCIGMCEQEVLLDIKKQGEERISYGNVTPDNVIQIIQEHLKNGCVVADLVLGKPIEE